MSRDPMNFCTRLVLGLFALCMLPPSFGSYAADAGSSMRGVLLGPERASPGSLAAWKARGVNSVVVPLDEASKRQWRPLAETVEKAGMSLWPWIEVARNPAMADAHPAWIAAIGAHHDDWRRRFLNAPAAKPDEVVKAWPWVPIGYAAAFDAHRRRINGLLADLPGVWAGVFLNDLQAGPSSCGCGNDQCRWALDYGSTPTSVKMPGDDAAARLVAEISAGQPGKLIVPVWVTECEAVDLMDAKGGTGLCGRVPCARGDCWPRYGRNWNALLKVTDGPIALGVWSETFRRDPTRWIESDLALFQTPPGGGISLAPERSIAIIQAWGKLESSAISLTEGCRPSRAGWVVAVEPIDQSWQPRLVQVPKDR